MPADTVTVPIAELREVMLEAGALGDYLQLIAGNVPSTSSEKADSCEGHIAEILGLSEAARKVAWSEERERAKSWLRNLADVEVPADAR